MSQHNQDDQTNAPGGKPSQAEGSRRTVEQDLGQNPGSDRQLNEEQPDPATRAPAGQPSQAEGDRETVEQDINQKLGSE